MAEHTEATTETTQEVQHDSTETEDNLFHKLYLFSLGLQKDLEESIHKLIERGELVSEEKQKLVDDLVKKAKESTGSFEKKLEDLLTSTLESMNFATRDKHDQLEKRVQILERKILELESRLHDVQSPQH
ncbi:hypothetical protein CSB45_05505 [candidate division KSB3 bacterium]|uniref:Uncharacterized protein n=1 Tax=candidate division KSB3 bacterium TaxID=2044937 RepID=A0A2G6E7F3_9BACT|nr:MAG: hypothetical protein CSB45_05505 [candidate division KSB3 bacterium]PIE30115.1 MAG: hypothetical protein CSA57_04220 [candidate division KSB3 bacterium]